MSSEILDSEEHVKKKGIRAMMGFLKNILTE